MVSFRKPGLFLMLLIITATTLIVTGCISRDNPTGNNWSDIHPLTFTDGDCFYAGYSFPGRDSVSGGESRLLSGNYEGGEAVAFMRFTGMPREGYFEIPSGYQDSTYLELTLVKRSPLERNPVDLLVYKLDQSWAADSTDMISDANLTQITFEAFSVPDSVSSDGTVVQLPLPMEEIENWYSDSEIPMWRFWPRKQDAGRKSSSNTAMWMTYRMMRTVYMINVQPVTATGSWRARPRCRKTFGK